MLLSARNLQSVLFEPAVQVSTYRILNANKLVFTESGLQKLTETLNA